MLKIITLISFSLFFSGHEKEKIYWEENFKLSWSNFKGNPDPSDSFKAISFCGISFIPTFNANMDSIDVNVQAYFREATSWYIKEDTSKDLLIHEQLHFDITELYARRLKKKLALSTFDFNKCNFQLDSTYKILKLNMDKEQEKYDFETLHGLDKQKQSEWNKNIKNLIEDLDLYSDSLIAAPLNYE